MNKFITRVAKLVLGLSLAAGVGVAIGSKASKEAVPAHAASTTYSMTPNSATTGSSATSYITSLTEFTAGTVSWKMNQWNPSSLQVKTNQSSASSEFRFYNTSAFAGKITQVVISFQSLTVSNENGFMFLGGTSQQTGTTSGTSGTYDSTANTITWTPASSTNYTYFAFYQNGKVASGTNKLAASDAIVVTYEVSSGPSLTIAGQNYLKDGSSTTLTGTITNNSNLTITWSASPSTGVSFSPATTSSGGNVSVSFNGVTTGTTPITITGTLNNTGTAVTKTFDIYALEHAGTSADPFSPTDAMVFSHKDYAAQTGGDWYVGGYVVGTYSTKGYYVDEDKTATSSPYKFEVYNSGGVPTSLDGKNITVGTSYIVAHGSMTYYEGGSQAEMSGATIVSVDNGNVPSVSITEGDQSIYMDDVLTFHATTEHAGEATVTWSSSNTAVATIGSSTGVVTTVGGGTTTITATITIDAVDYTDSVELEVTAPLLKSGDSIIFYSGEAYLTDINDGGSTHYGNKTDTEAEAVVYTVETGNAENSYAFVNGGNYLTWSSGNSLDYASSITDNSSWTITGDALTNCVIKNVKDSSRVMKYNSGAPRFACYTSGQNAVSIKKIVVADPTTLTLDTNTLSLEAEEVSAELTFATDSPSAAFSWYSEDTSKATVSNGVITAGTQTNVTVKIYVYFDTDGSGDFDPAKDLNDYCTVTITAPVIDYSAVTYGGTGVKITSSNASTYLANGKKVIMTNSDSVVAGAYGSYIPATSTSVTFSNSTVTVGDGTSEMSITIFELETAPGGFYLKTKDGKYLSNTSSSTSAGNFSKTDEATTVWVLSDAGMYDASNEANATVQFNSGANPSRFKPYKSSFAGDAVVLYSFTEYTDEAEAYAAGFNSANVCGTTDNTKADSSIWMVQKSSYEALSAGAQHLLAIATANAESSDAIQQCLARYDRVIYLHYTAEAASYPDFMNRISGGYVTPLASAKIVDSILVTKTGTSVSIIVIISLVSLTAVGGYFFIKRRKESN